MDSIIVCRGLETDTQTQIQCKNSIVVYNSVYTGQQVELSLASLQSFSLVFSQPIRARDHRDTFLLTQINK